MSPLSDPTGDSCPRSLPERCAHPLPAGTTHLHVRLRFLHGLPVNSDQPGKRGPPPLMPHRGYRFDVDLRQRKKVPLAPPFIVSMNPPGYPSAGCIPAFPASASPSKVIVAPPRPSGSTSGSPVTRPQSGPPPSSVVGAIACRRQL